MLALVFSIPVIACLLLFVFFRDRVSAVEYLFVLIPSILISTIIYVSTKYADMMDTEYLGYYVTDVTYYEPWNEYIHKTCSREVYVGRDENGNSRYETEYYDCSYVDYHNEYWTMRLNDGRTIDISHDEYEEIARRFGTPRVFVDLHRYYYTQDGDKYVCSFNGDRDRMKTVTLEHRYKNKVKKSRSIFNFSEVSDEEADSIGLYDYPDVSRDQNPIIGYNPGSSVIDSFKYVNGYYGSQHQFRCYVIIYKNKPQEIVEKQKDFLIGGNKNELIVCISIDDAGCVQWVEAFSWEDTPYITVGCNHLYEQGETLDLLKLERYLLENVPKNWKRKEFVDFDYINIPVSPTAWIWIILSAVIICIIMSLFVIFNDF